MPWRFSKYRMLHYKEGEMEGETIDEKHFLLQKLESVQILFL